MSLFPKGKCDVAYHPSGCSCGGKPMILAEKKKIAVEVLYKTLPNSSACRPSSDWFYSEEKAKTYCNDHGYEFIKILRTEQLN